MTKAVQELLEDMCRVASPRKEKTLRLIYQICEEQDQRGSRDFSVTTVGRVSAERGGPSAGAIRNKTGEEYRALMKAFADSVGGKSRKGGERRPDKADEILEGIVDPVLRTRIGLMLAEIESLRAQLLATRHLANTTSTIRLESVSPAPVAANEGGVAQADDLSAMELRALKSAISDRTISHWGWSTDDEGRVLSDTGQVVFQAGFLAAIRKVIARNR